MRIQFFVKLTQTNDLYGLVRVLLDIVSTMFFGRELAQDILDHALGTDISIMAEFILWLLLRMTACICKLASTP